MAYGCGASYQQKHLKGQMQLKMLKPCSQKISGKAPTTVLAHEIFDILYVFFAPWLSTSDEAQGSSLAPDMYTYKLPWPHIRSRH